MILQKYHKILKKSTKLTIDFNLILCQNRSMTTDKIKEKLERFVERYQENIGSFDGFLVISEFFEFITIEPKIKGLLKGQFEYCEQQMKIVEDMPDGEMDKYLPSNVVLDVNRPEDWNLAIFQKEHNDLVKMVKESEPLNVVSLEMPVALLNLSLIFGLFKQASEDSKNNPKDAEEIIQKIKQLSATHVPFKVKDQNKENSFSLMMPQYYLRCLAVVSLYIVNELGAKEFLKGNKPAPSVKFNKDESLLIIKGTKIKISRTNDRPIDHYILEAIWDSEDISDEVYFRDVAKKMDEFADYDKKKDGRRFYRACQHLNQKVQTDTDNKVIKFLEPHSTWCKINPKYLKS